MSKIAFIYPGQGAQKAGMGADFYENSTLAAEVYEEAGELLGLDIRSLCFTENEQLDQTEYTQAAMVTTCLAMTRVLMERGIKPDITAGLSLGEYCAISVAGGMSRQDAIRTVRTRGILMQNAVPAGEGAMAAVLGLDGKLIEEVTDTIEGVSVANYNCPGQIVITGKKNAVEEALGKLKEAGAKRTVFLNVSGAFHSPLLKEAGKELEQVLEQINFTELGIPYVTNVTAEAVTDIKETKKLLTEQISEPVRWQQSMEYMIQNGVDTFVEIGPGRTLSGFLRKISREVKVYQVGTWEEMEQAVKILTAQEEQVC